jgi:hypothetical protein
VARSSLSALQVDGHSRQLNMDAHPVVIAGAAVKETSQLPMGSGPIASLLVNGCDSEDGITPKMFVLSRVSERGEQGIGCREASYELIAGSLVVGRRFAQGLRECWAGEQFLVQLQRLLALVGIFELAGLFKQEVRIGGPCR